MARSLEPIVRRELTGISEFLAAVNQHSVFPIDVLCGEFCTIGLRRARLVKQFVVRFAFYVFSAAMTASCSSAGIALFFWLWIFGQARLGRIGHASQPRSTARL